MRALAMTGMVTASWMPLMSSGSDMRATPPSRRMSAGTRSSAITAAAPASSAILACSASTTSMITPPLSISARPALTRKVASSRIRDGGYLLHAQPKFGIRTEQPLAQVPALPLLRAVRARQVRLLPGGAARRALEVIGHAFDGSGPRQARPGRADSLAANDRPGGVRGALLVPGRRRPGLARRIHAGGRHRALPRARLRGGRLPRAARDDR